jgi:hypothetical protein
MNPTATARILAGTSILGLAVAVAATVLGHVGLGPGFNPLALTVSDYALSDRGAAIEVAMVMLAGASLALLVGLAAARAPVRGIPTVLLLVWAAGLLLAAAVPTDPIGTPVLSTAGYVHRYASVAAFLCLPAAALMLASRFATEPAWRALSSMLRRLAGASGVGLALLFYVAFPGDRILIGLVERALIGVEVVVLLLLALRLLRSRPPVPVLLVPLPRTTSGIDQPATGQPVATAASVTSRGWTEDEVKPRRQRSIRPAARRRVTLGRFSAPRIVIHSIITSLDGYVADEDGNLAWSGPDQEVPRPPLRTSVLVDQRCIDRSGLVANTDRLVT